MSQPVEEKNSERSAQSLEIPLNSDLFFRTLIRELAGTLEDVIGLKNASGYFSIVGQSIGDKINREYRKAWESPHLDSGQVADVLVDLKSRISGDFYILEQAPDKIVLGNRKCPFGDAVIGREAMCMMTSNVFGSITADNLGYAMVELQETIARGDRGCKVVVHLTPPNHTDKARSREYFRTET